MQRRIFRENFFSDSKWLLSLSPRRLRTYRPQCGHPHKRGFHFYSYKSAIRPKRGYKISNQWLPICNNWLVYQWTQPSWVHTKERRALKAVNFDNRRSSSANHWQALKFKSSILLHWKCSLSQAAELVGPSSSGSHIGSLNLRLAAIFRGPSVLNTANFGEIKIWIGAI